MPLLLKGKNPDANILQGLKKLLNSSSKNSGNLADAAKKDASSGASNKTGSSEISKMISPDAAMALDSKITKKKQDTGLLAEIKGAVKDTTKKVKKITKDKQVKSSVKAISKFAKSAEGKSELKNATKILKGIKSGDMGAVESNLTSILSKNPLTSAKFNSALALINKTLCSNPNMSNSANKNAGIASNPATVGAIDAILSGAAFSLLSCPLDKNTVTKMALNYIKQSGAQSLKAFATNGLSKLTGNTSNANAVTSAVVGAAISGKKLSATEVTKSVKKSKLLSVVAKTALKEIKSKKNKKKDVLTYDNVDTTTAKKEDKKDIVSTALAINKKTDIYTTETKKPSKDSPDSNLVATAKKAMKETVPKANDSASSLDDITKIAIAGGKANKNLTTTNSSAYV